MKNNFTKLTNRKDQGSAKWIDMYSIKEDVGIDVVPLSVADMEFENPREIIEGLKSFLNDAVLGYTVPTQRYYEAVVNWMKKRHSWDIDKEDIVCAPGVVPALHNSICAFTEQGDGVILLTPVYYPFFSSVKNHGRKVITSSLVEEQGRYTIDYEDLEEKSKDNNNKLLLLCNPHNPIGRVWSEHELKKIGDICKRNNIIVISDEIHNDLIMPGFKHTVFQNVDSSFKDFSIVCTSPSKTFNLAGMQTSNIIIPNRNLREKYIKCTMNSGNPFLNVLGYESCILAYEKCEGWLDELIETIYDNSLTVKLFFDKYMPEVRCVQLEGTYLQWLDFRELLIDHKKMEHINVQKAEVFFDEGYIFGKEGIGFERINLACPKEVINKALERLYKAYKEEGLIV